MSSSSPVGLEEDPHDSLTSLGPDTRGDGTSIGDLLSRSLVGDVPDGFPTLEKSIPRKKEDAMDVTHKEGKDMRKVSLKEDSICVTMTHPSSPASSAGDKSTQQKRTKSSERSIHLPSHNMQWTKEEQHRFLLGLREHGKGHWKKIATLVGSRNSLQVKNHARVFFQKVERAGIQWDSENWTIEDLLNRLEDVKNRRQQRKRSRSPSPDDMDTESCPDVSLTPKKSKKSGSLKDKDSSCSEMGDISPSLSSISSSCASSVTSSLEYGAPVVLLKRCSGSGTFSEDDIVVDIDEESLKRKVLEGSQLGLPGCRPGFLAMHLFCCHDEGMDASDSADTTPKLSELQLDRPLTFSIEPSLIMDSEEQDEIGWDRTSLDEDGSPPVTAVSPLEIWPTDSIFDFDHI
eukprot:TRINITY_DN94_c0_g1_i1.p1 TRINITY_DN94_c0_g1~~TRINITY_DN94_c0_g1_i1.p1  ORF type:complete len:402 (+),score=103.29 TRINITY_DN94_c0_g1_i1:132-1337(+)